MYAILSLIIERIGIWQKDIQVVHAVTRSKMPRHGFMLVLAVCTDPVQ
jgi:hypothetical protein